MKKPSPVPDPIIPEGYKYKMQHFHTGNTKQSQLDFMSDIKGCIYITHCSLYDLNQKPLFKKSVACGLSFCSPSDTPNRRKGTIIAVHRAVKKIYPDFYKNLRQNKRN